MQVVVDGQLLTPRLDVDALGAGSALEPDEFELVRLVSQLCARLLVGDLAAGEALTLLHDLPHPLLDALQIVGMERLRDVEVVVEPVVDRRPDAELRLGEQILHGLGQNVGRRVTQDRAALRRIDGDGLHRVAVLDDVRQIAQHTVDASGDDRLVVGEQHDRLQAAGRQDLLMLRHLSYPLAVRAGVRIHQGDTP